MTKLKSIISIALAAGAVSTVSFAQDEASQSADREQIMVVLDASGSMWGRVEGKTKISIVRKAYSDFIADWDGEKVDTGLIAYGHRRKGDCSDIELLATPGQKSDRALKRIVKNLSPKGKTPLGDAVRMAAEELKYTEQSATVILLSDGVETCGVDPCQLGLDLEKSGVDFTAHVVGLDIKSEADKAQLQCLAENTGGQFTTVENARELDEALSQTVKAVQTLSFQGLIGDSDIPASYVAWTLTGSDVNLSAHSDSGSLPIDAISEGSLPPGRYIITGQAENYSGSTEFNLPSSESVINVHLFPAVPTTRLTVIGDIYVDAEFEVQWEGEGFTEDRISVVPVGGAWDTAISTAVISSGNPVRLKAPTNAGPYELIYLSNRYELNRLDKRVKIDVLESQYQLKSVGDIRAGQDFMVDWKGPGIEGDMIAIGPRTSGSDDYSALTWVEGAGPVSLTAPDSPGDYELRYYGDGYQLQFVQPVTVK